MHSHSEHRHSTETQSHCGCGHDHAKKQTGCSSQSTANICHDSSNSVSEHSHQEGDVVVRAAIPMTAMRKATG
ncbi:zinc/cadmium/mercury/lead-transporting ATPase [Yersinia enterocolitica]|uniref:Zinc/cadmium/mercury/lead-transporting ATPase n=1 Tax=Yersinia enterocolitica TaxID=630 RepID=A0ABP1Y3T7_YEREN|nr:zinc/cadmium/mercury/lead-transporting ATPase [Yersinia enterocolitica]CQD72680.1 zinc/cadmium/mercury/lead-transporting ATPase [Yersinia enterocolitica]CQH83731.1 zinc/cadmium/mercury/lead-transporting ATPase [Yersinia enterocolitica]CRX87241.1 zinc/cadmium/mercury/lead-transporting ATPase [Yersinia enterocolitica]